MDGDQITELAAHVKAAVEEFDHAVAFHETWKPTVQDQELLSRIGTSYATNTFLVIRAALRREMLLALMRLWDTKKTPGATRMTALKERVCDETVREALVAARALNSDGSERVFGLRDRIRGVLKGDAVEVKNLVQKWCEGGSKYPTLERLKILRNEVLAHRQIVLSSPGAVTPDESAAEEFYQDNLRLIQLLLSIVNGVAYNPNDTANVYRQYSDQFWAGVKGERTDGHPNKRATEDPTLSE